MSRRSIVVSILLVTAFVVAANGQTSIFTYQGRLADGVNPASGTYEMRFELFDALSGGLQQPQPSPITLDFTVAGGNAVTVTNGVFTVPLDFTAASFGGAGRWLEIAVRKTTDPPGFTLLTPRQPVTSAPYSVKSLNADNATNATNATNAVNATTATTATNATQLNGQPATFYQNAANLNSGTLDALRLPVPLTLSGTSPTHILRADNASTDGIGVFGSATAASGSTYGVVGQSQSTTGNGVLGSATAATGFANGVWGESQSTSGKGVVGLANAITGTTYGGFFQNASTSGRGVFGYAYATTGNTYGVYGRNDSTSGIGVFGEALATTGTDHGVFGRSASTDGNGVTGYATAASGINYGVVGQSDSTSGRGVYGTATTTTGFAYGVLGQTAPPNIGYAVYAIGDMGASGLKPFRIDHPFDPENKYLLHYATESPMPQNFYLGNVVTDAEGYAWVELPNYFQEINANFKYQLTVVDDADADGFVMAKVSKEIRGNQFQIRTSAPNIKVSWRIDADRNDLYVRRKQPKDVVEKQGREKGTYQHPELYGQPAEKGMNHTPRDKASGGPRINPIQRGLR